MWPVELGREETCCGLEDLVRPLQFGVLLLQRVDLCGFLCSRPGPSAAVDLVLADHERSGSVEPIPSLLATAFIAAHSVV